jgi:hypothetical protein
MMMMKRASAGLHRMHPEALAGGSLGPLLLRLGW